MTTQHWSDYHAWRVSRDTIQAAQLTLSDADYAALLRAAKPSGLGYIVPREAIEDAALAMPPSVAIQFLAAVYQLDHPTADKLLAAIRAVRQIGAHFDIDLGAPSSPK